MDRSVVEAWLDAYVEAWLTYDRQAIAELFSEDAEYRYNPHDPPAVGRDEIVESWLSDRDDPGTYHGDYRVFAIDGDRAVVIGVTTYFEDERHETIAAVYDNCFLVEFDDDGACRSFTEWFYERPR